MAAHAAENLLINLNILPALYTQLPALHPLLPWVAIEALSYNEFESCRRKPRGGGRWAQTINIHDGGSERLKTTLSMRLIIHGRLEKLRRCWLFFWLYKYWSNIIQGEIDLSLLLCILKLMTSWVRKYQGSYSDLSRDVLVSSRDAFHPVHHLTVPRPQRRMDVSLLQSQQHVAQINRMVWPGSPQERDSLPPPLEKEVFFPCSRYHATHK